MLLYNLLAFIGVTWIHLFGCSCLRVREKGSCPFFFGMSNCYNTSCSPKREILHPTAEPRALLRDRDLRRIRKSGALLMQPRPTHYW
jgi:hypothetical protein